MEKLVKYIKEMEDLKLKIYYMILVVGSLAVLLSLIADIFQGLDETVIAFTAVCFIFEVILLAVSLKFHVENVGKYVLVFFFNLFFFPVTFIAGGGITSGMTLCYLLAVFILSLLLEGRARVITYIICICALECSIYYSYLHQDDITLLSYKDSIVDIGVTLLIISATVLYMITLILNAYEDERRKSHELNDRLREMSVKDELSGLYNRRELFRRLDSIYQSRLGGKVPSSREDCYIAMFDIDNFKSLNDTYGHQFGDLVLSTIARIIKSNSDEGNGELAARYGGEEFVSVLRAYDMKAALEKVDRIRREIEEKRWEHDPELVVTISGGLVCCEEYDDLKKAIHDADEHLYEAKHDGKNRIKA